MVSAPVRPEGRLHCASITYPLTTKTLNGPLTPYGAAMIHDRVNATQLKWQNYHRLEIVLKVFL